MQKCISMPKLGSTHSLHVGAQHLYSRAPKDHITIRILQTMVFGIPIILALKTRM